jgi:hypothetical protein
MDTAPNRWLPWLQLVLGLAMATAGALHTLWALPQEWHQLRPAAHQGVALMGSVVVLRALAELSLKLESAGKLDAPGAPHAWERLRAALTSPRTEVLVGLLVMGSGLSEAYQLATAPHPASGAWHWGVALAGLLVVLRAVHATYEGLEHLHQARLGPRVLQRLTDAIERPGVQLATAVALLALAGLESTLPPELPAGDGAGAPVGHHGLAALGGLNVARCLPALLDGSKLTWRRLTAASGQEDAA